MAHAPRYERDAIISCQHHPSASFVYGIRVLLSSSSFSFSSCSTSVELTIGKVLSRGQMSRRNRSNVIHGWRKKFPARDLKFCYLNFASERVRKQIVDACANCWWTRQDKVETMGERIRDIHFNRRNRVARMRIYCIIFK